jgi:hypothetical protein
MRERTANILLMSVTLEVLKLSGWLKAAACKEFEYACCRVRSGSPTEVNACGTRRCVTGGSGGISSARGVRMWPSSGVGAEKAHRRERTANILLMSVTLDVSKLSGWLKAFAFCRVQRGHPTQGNACGMEMWHR